MHPGLNAIFGPVFFFEKGDFLVQKPGFLNKNPSFFFPKAGFRPKTGIFKNRDIGNSGRSGWTFAIRVGCRRCVY